MFFKFISNIYCLFGRQRLRPAACTRLARIYAYQDKYRNNFPKVAYFLIFSPCASVPLTVSAKNAQGSNVGNVLNFIV